MYEIICKEKVPGSIKAINKGICLRCEGSNIKKDYAGIEYCLDCYFFREINSELHLLRSKRDIPKKKHLLNLEIILSDDQVQGSSFLVNCYKKRKNGILQAVCGAGKTEVSLALIHLALNADLRIAFVIPRVEIIKQVVLRMKEYLPKTDIGCLFGGSSQVKTEALIITTPQQLIKFYQEFDLMIIDEVDAFPLVGNVFLERLISKSKKKNAVMIYMSATISEKYHKLIKDGEIDYLLIAKRYHNQALSLPTFIKTESYKTFLVMKTISKLLKTNKQLIIYVSSIKRGESLLKELITQKFKCNLITSQTKYKNLVIRDFKQENTMVLISTTILERGVTFSNINVIVLEADNKVFSEASLIQIAGRVGRMGDDAEVVFMSKYISKAMISAKKKITEFNRHLK